MKPIGFSLLTCIALGAVSLLMSAPQGAAPKSAAGSMANTNWRGAIGEARGNEPATFKIVSQDGNLRGILTYEDYEETLDVIVSGSSVRMKGVSFRDLSRQGRPFNLDTFNGQISQNGRVIRGQARDSQGNGSSWEFTRLGR